MASLAPSLGSDLIVHGSSPTISSGYVLIHNKAHWAFRQSAVDLGEGELGRDTFKSPYQSSHDLMLFSSNEQVYKNYMGSLGGDIINSLYSQGSKTES